MADMDTTQAPERHYKWVICGPAFERFPRRYRQQYCPATCAEFAELLNKHMHFHEHYVTFLQTANLFSRCSDYFEDLHDAWRTVQYVLKLADVEIAFPVEDYFRDVADRSRWRELCN